ncbi:MAG: ankyrin repeat domain-containing protein [Pseudomonadales bacterium]
MRRNVMLEAMVRLFQFALSLPAFTLLLTMGGACASAAWAQTPPSSTEIDAYTGLLAAASGGDVAALRTGLDDGANPDVHDAYGRTPLHVAAYAGQHEIIRLLVAAGAEPNALENDRYDIVTIAAVANDVPTLEVALALGAKATNVTSRYDGTALIAAAHLGHVDVVKILVRAGAPLDHVNNLGWTALIESIVLGDGGARHTETLKVLVDAGANVDLPDGNGHSPRALAQARGFTEMVRILEAAGARCGCLSTLTSLKS